MMRQLLLWLKRLLFDDVVKDVDQESEEEWLDKQW